MHSQYSTEVFDLMPHQVWTATSDGKLDYFNKQWFDYSHWDYEHSKGQGWTLAIHPDDLPALATLWKHSLESRQPYQTKARVLKYDHSYRWFMIQAQPILNEDGSVFKWLGTNTDIDELIITSEELDVSYGKLNKVEGSFDQLKNELEGRVESRTAQLQADTDKAYAEKNKLYRFFMQIPAGICVLEGPDFVFDLVNPIYQQFFPNRELLNKPLFEALPELKNSEIEKRLQHVYATGETFVGKEQLVPLAQGKDGPMIDRYFDIMYQAKYNEENEIDGVFVFGFEMTVQVKARMELELKEHTLQTLNNDLHSSNEELHAANEEVVSGNDELSRVNNLLQGINSDLDNFVYTASHDLKSPISNLEGLADVLREHIVEGKSQQEDLLDILGMMDDSIVRFKKTLEQLSDISKVQFIGHSEARLVSISEVLQEILLDLAQDIGDTKAHIITRLSQCTDVYMSEKNLRSILYNLVSNAIKYNNPQRPLVVEVECEENQEYYVLKVKDNGLGIPEANQHKLFKMFTRLHSHVEGTGVGLYMVKKIVENGGGHIEVESSPEGTLFTVYLKKKIGKTSLGADRSVQSSAG